MFSDQNVHEKTGRGKGFYQEYRDGYGQFTGNEKISKERFIRLGGIPSEEMPKPRQEVIGKKWMFLLGSFFGGSLSLLLTILF